jgi:hypothetical protein
MKVKNPTQVSENNILKKYRTILKMDRENECYLLLARKFGKK